MTTRRSLVPAIAFILALAAVAPALAQDASPPAWSAADVQALVDIPIPAQPREPGEPEAPEIIAERWLAATTDEQRRDVVLDVLATIGMGVYAADGTPILVGAERAEDDPWLYDFEVALMAVDPALAVPVSVADIAGSLVGVVGDAAGMPIDPQALADLIRSSTADALAEPSDPVGFPLRLARQLELGASGHDLAEEVPILEPLTSLAAYLIELDIILPLTLDGTRAEASAPDVWAPVAARIGSSASRRDTPAAAPAPRTADTTCGRIGSWAGKSSWDAGKLGARLLKGWSRMAGNMGAAQLLHRIYLRHAIEVTGGVDNHEIHYRHPDEGPDFTGASFWTQVFVNVQLPQETRACGALAGLRLPKAGPLQGIPVQWMTGPLSDHGTIWCLPATCQMTGADGIATLEFAVGKELQMPGDGPEEYDRALVASQASYLLPLGNDWGYVPLSGAWKFRDVRISWHVPEPSYEVSGSAPSKPGGIRFSGRACSLDEPFEVKTKGDMIGTLEFHPTGDLAGTWSYRGKTFNAPLKVVGSGDYSAEVSDDRSSGSVDLDGKLTVKIPAVGDQTRDRAIHLTLTAAPPCTD